MERLPNELRQDVLQHLVLSDVKSIRLASKDWARLGADYLIKPTVYTLPHRDDFTRLLQLSRHPLLESYVQRIVFNCGYIRHNLMGFESTAFRCVELLFNSKPTRVT